MSETPSRDSEGVSPTILGQIELVCDRFESAWRNDAKPRVEDYWREADGPDLLRELLVLELAYRIKRHDRPSPADYYPRFPAHRKVIREAFETVPARDRSPGPPAPASARLSGEWNLLFGVLAMQMDFITREALIAAVSTWVLDKSKPLDRIMVEQGALGADERDLLEPLIQKHLERHGGDPVREALRHIADPEVDASLALLGDLASTHIAADTSQANRFFTEHPGVQRFHVLRPLASGGLGEVFVARDQELHREVALKLIQEQHAGDPRSRTRFQFEAQITGRLEHPGVIPVYGLGVDERGRAYYAMRFVRGESLKDSIARFHRETGQTREAGERSLAFRELLSRFVDVCNTMAYAHGRGILHRDLKPANIMLGPYGETLVVDWGLAKAAGSADGEPSTRDRTLELFRASDGGATEPGSWLGTPSYMSPEQAAGQIDQLGPASDVYSLGATLYNLLTGKIAFDDRDVFTLLGKIRAGDFPPPRSVDPTIDPALESVCKKAMALSPADRYASCRALADDVKRWAADEPVSSWRESIRDRARRWAKRNRTAVAAAAVAVVAAVIGLSAVLVVQTRAKGDLTRSLARETAARTELFHSREAVQARYRLAVDAIKTFHTGVSEDFLLKEDQFKELRDRLLRSASDYYGELAALLAEQTDKASRRALLQAEFEVAELTAKVGREEAAIEAHRKVLAARQAFAADLTDAAESAEARTDLGRSLTAVAILLDETGQTSDAEATYREAERLLATTAQGPPVTATRWAALAACRFRLGTLLFALGKPADSLSVLRQAQADQDLLATAPGASAITRNDQARTISSIGAFLSEMGKPRDAEAEYLKAVAIQQKLVDANPAATEFRADLVNTRRLLGIVLQTTGRPAAAEAEYRAALAIQQKLADENPAVTGFRKLLASSYSSLGMVLSETGKPTEAIAEYRKALAIQQKLVDDNPTIPNFRHLLASSHNNIGSGLSSTGKTLEAEAEFRKALAIRETLARDHPGVADFRSRLALAHYNLGRLLWTTGKPSAGEAEYRKAIVIRQELARENPSLTQYQTDLAHSHTSIGGALRAAGKAPEAEAEFRDALAIHNKLAEANPSVTRFRSSQALTHYNIGELLSSTLDWPRAITEFRKAIAIQQRLADENPGVTDFRNYLAISHLDLGWALLSTRKTDEAESEYRRAQAIHQKLTDENPSVTGFRIQLAQVHSDLGVLLLTSGKPADAEVEHRKSMAIRQTLADENPNVAEYRRELTRSLNNVGEALIPCGRAAEAIDVYLRSRDILETLVKENPATPEFSSGLAYSLSGLGRALRIAGDRAAAAMNLGRSVLLWERQAALSPGSRYDLARSHALIAILAGESGSGVSPAEGRTAADRAITELKRAVAAGYRNPRMDVDADFDPLRARPDFQILMLDLAFPDNPFAG
jgi:eukaryotic-like serine/threonine-protein kinase